MFYTVSIAFFVIVLLASVALSLDIELQCPPEGCANVSLYMGPRWGSKTIQLPKLVTNTTGNINKTQVSCPVEGCSNVTLYLGQRWGSKITHFPNYSKVRGPSEEETRMASNYTGSLSSSKVYEGYSNVHKAGTAQPLVQRRLIPDDGSVSVADAVDMQEFQARTRRPTEWDKYVPFESQNEVLDYAGLGFTGDNVKQSLSRLSEEESGRVRRLHLSHNNIQELPVLTFPVALEYHLQDLQLDHNPLTHLSTYTCFELSRLGNLKILNLTSTGLQSLLYLYIPSLEVLDVSNNELYFLPSNIATFVKLMVLDASGNRLYEVTTVSKELGSLNSLIHLNLANNNMSRVVDDSFKKLYHLETLRLNNNSLTSISHVSIPQFARVYLHNNPWQCSCFLVDAIRKTRLQVMDNFTVTCVDEKHRVRLVRLLTTHEFPCVSSVKTLDMLLHEQLLQYMIIHSIFVVFYAILGWTLFLTVVVLVVWRVRKARAKGAPLDVPYNIMDDRQVV